MLQQTRVETVTPYYERFLARFPDALSLAEAPIDDVLALWSGLGYYRRARQLHACAKVIADEHGGAMPRDPEALRALPGVGPYTAGAIASIAYNRRAPLVDGNVARVIARLAAIDAPIKDPRTLKVIWSIAERLVPEDEPGSFNEALMELGAMVCTPRDPRCEGCPVASICEARARGIERDLPIMGDKKSVPDVPCVALVMRDGEGRVLFARRAIEGLFGGMWEPPILEGATRAGARRAIAAMGIPIEGVKLTGAGEIKHVLTHRRMLVEVVTCAVKDAPVIDRVSPPYEEARFVDPAAEGLGVSTLARKILAAADKPSLF